MDRHVFDDRVRQEAAPDLVDRDDPDRKRMLYRLFFRDGAGNRLTLSGFKVIEDDPGFDAWSDTTTLFTIYRSPFTAVYRFLFTVPRR